MIGRTRAAGIPMEFAVGRRDRRLVDAGQAQLHQAVGGEFPVLVAVGAVPLAGIVVVFEGNRIAVRFAYEYHDDSGQWYRAYGNENWEFAPDGLMRLRLASINEAPIAAADRKFHWDASGPRPADHASLSELGF